MRMPLFCIAYGCVPETTNKLRDILASKEEMISSIDSQFDLVYSSGTYLATLRGSS